MQEFSDIWQELIPTGDFDVEVDWYEINGVIGDLLEKEKERELAIGQYFVNALEPRKFAQFVDTKMILDEFNNKEK